MNENEPSTPAQHEAIREAARRRVDYILWLASQLEKSGQTSSRLAAAELRQLVGVEDKEP